MSDHIDEACRVAIEDIAARARAVEDAVSTIDGHAAGDFLEQSRPMLEQVRDMVAEIEEVSGRLLLLHRRFVPDAGGRN